MDTPTFHRSVLEQVLHEEVDSEFLVGMLKILGNAYEETRNYCRPPRFGPNEAKDTRGHVLRGHVETGLRRLASDFGFETESRLNSQRSYYHTLVRIGRILLTASSVNYPSCKPRRADFRNSYAANGQLSFSKNNFDLCSDSLYAVFRYGPLQAQSPSIATVSFPSEDWKSLLENINLLGLFPGVIQLPILDQEEVQEPIPKIGAEPEERIQQPEVPKLRRTWPYASGEE